MSGHSKWHSIKHKKGAVDAKRGKIFTKIIKEIIVAARLGGGDENTNPRLRTVVMKAKAANMPKDNIDRAVKKGTGELEGVDYIELNYEAYAQGGVGLLIETLTENRNRTTADVRMILSKCGGQLAATGAVSYMFKRRGLIVYEDVDFEALFEAALEMSVEDITEDAGIVEIVTEVSDFTDVLEALQSGGFQQSDAELVMLPDNTVTLDADGTAKVLHLIERLEDNDDIQSVASNLEVPKDFEMP